MERDIGDLTVKKLCQVAVEARAIRSSLVANSVFGCWRGNNRTQTGTLYQPSVVEWGERWEGGRFKWEGIYVYLWLIHVEVWQKTAKLCKSIILQLQNK